MKVSCLQENLAKGLSIVGRSIATRSTLPVLANILITTEESDRVKLSASNLEMGINCWIGAKVEEAGAITIPARLLNDFVNSLPPERIDFVLDQETETVNLTCANFGANLRGIAAQEFPAVPTLDAGDDIIRVDPVALKSAINQVCFAAASDESRPILTGILMEFETETLIMSGADGYRFSRKTIPLAHPIEEKVEVVVPARALAEVARIIGDQEEPVQIAVTSGQNQILVHLNEINLVSQLLEGRFPDLKQVIPQEHNTRTVVDRRSFLNAAKISHLFAKDAANIVKVDVTSGQDELDGGRVVLAATSQELGDNISELPASVKGEEVEIAFNAKYLMDVLGVLDSPQVVLETTASASPGVLHPIDDESFTHVIMPMHLSK